MALVAFTYILSLNLRCPRFWCPSCVIFFISMYRPKHFGYGTGVLGFSFASFLFHDWGQVNQVIPLTHTPSVYCRFLSVASERFLCYYYSSYVSEYWLVFFCFSLFFGR